MAEGEEGWQRLIRGLGEADPRIEREFCEQYGPALHRLADKYLAKGLRRRVGPDDVVQSACRTFLRRARAGEYQLADGEALWGVLCAITLTKIREQARFHLRQKRGLDRETPDAGTADDSSGAGGNLLDPNPTPAQAAEFADQLQQVLAGLDEEERQIVDLKLQEYTHDEVAQRLGCSERTVRRLLKRVQARLARAFAGP